VRLGLKLVLGFLAVGLAGVGLVALVAVRGTANEFGRFVLDQRQGSFADTLRQYYQEHGGWAGVQEVLVVMPDGARGRMFERSVGPLTLTDAQGVVIIAGPGLHPGAVLRQELLRAATPVEVNDRVVGFFVASPEAFARSQAEANFLRRTNRLLIIGASGAIGLSLLLGIVLSRSFTQPIGELTRASQAIAAGDLEQQVPVRSEDELGELAQAFNQMSAQLARARDLRRQMTADIAHELRTPLSVILGQIDALDDGVVPPSPAAFEILRDETARLGRLVEDLRTLSRADAGELALERRLAAPARLLEQAAAAHRPLAMERAISIELQAPAGLPEVDVDPDRMAQVLGNLLSNALRHTPPGGEIKLAAGLTDGAIELRVQDSGPGVDPQDLPHLFDRFYRADRSRQRETGGSGLGLAIARTIVELHGGRIRAESAPGEGAAMIIHLPAAPPASQATAAG
jgi:signal transduction histidine kinase